jgi:hypothetical protein
MRRNEPHWLLNDQDGKAYAQALVNAMRHLPVGVPQKVTDFSALAFMVFNMESPRVLRSAQLAAQRRNPPRGPATVFQFHPAAPAPQASTETSGSPPPFPEGLGIDPAAEQGGPFPAA